MAKPNRTRDDAKASAPAMVAAMVALNPAMTKAWMDIMSESTRFLIDRLNQGLATQKAMLACKTPTELLEVRAAFFKTAIEQYTAFGGHLKETVPKVTEEMTIDMKSCYSRSYDDVPL